MTNPDRSPTKPLSASSAVAATRNVGLMALASPFAILAAVMVTSYNAGAAVAGITSDTLIDPELSKAMKKNILSQGINGAGGLVYELSVYSVVNTLSHAANASGHEIPKEYIKSNWLAAMGHPLVAESFASAGINVTKNNNDNPEAFALSMVEEQTNQSNQSRS